MDNHPGIRVGQIWAHLTYHVSVFAITEYDEYHEWEDGRKKDGPGWFCGGSWIPDGEVRALLTGDGMYLLADPMCPGFAPRYVGTDPVPRYRLAASTDAGIWEVIVDSDIVPTYVGRMKRGSSTWGAPLDFDNAPIGPAGMWLPEEVAVRWVIWNWRNAGPK